MIVRYIKYAIEALASTAVEGTYIGHMTAGCRRMGSLNDTMASQSVDGWTNTLSAYWAAVNVDQIDRQNTRFIYHEVIGN